MSNQYQPSSIGQIAFEILSSDQEAAVLGKSSRGIFVKTASRWIVFISLEAFRGPLTITLPANSPSATSPFLLNRQIHNVSPRMPVIIRSNQLSIPAAGITITIQKESGWQPPAPPTSFSRKNSEEKLSVLAKKAIVKDHEAEIGAFLPPLLQIPVAANKTSNSIINERDILGLQKGVGAHDVFAVTKITRKIMGVGKGLTPLGDDLIIGLLLSLNRQKEALWPDSSLFDLNHQIIKEAYKKTTTISANLIECAAMGKADERLLATIDWLCHQDSDCGTPPTHLFEWGNSSGFAVFTGMAIAISS